MGEKDPKFWGSNICIVALIVKASTKGTEGTIVGLVYQL